MKEAVWIVFPLVVISAYCNRLNKNFSCPDGTNIPTWYYCERAKQCPDNSPIYYGDYGSGSGDYGSGEYTQSAVNITKTCVMKQCTVEVFSSDMDFCYSVTPCDIMDPNYYKCGDFGCIKRSNLCDRNRCTNCFGVDIWPNGVGFKCIRNKTICKLPQQLLYDDVQDCDDAVDLCFPDSRLAVTNTKPTSAMNTSRCFECMGGDMFIQRTQVCDGVFDCKDLSDECLCGNRSPTICHNIGLYRQANDTSSQNPCGFRELNCGDGKCVNALEVMCNSFSDCRNNRDEGYEHCRGTLRCENGLKRDEGKPCRCPQTTRCEIHEATLCNLVDECLPEKASWIPEPGYPADECKAECPNKSTFGCVHNAAFLVTDKISATGFSSISCRVKLIVNNTQVGTVIAQVGDNGMCNGILTCTEDRYDENNETCTDRFFCPSLGSVNIELSKMCDGVVDCDDGSDELNTTCPHRFFCKAKNGDKVSIDPQKVCNFVIDCDNGEDELNCDDGRFYCEGRQPLYVLGSQTFNGIRNCMDWSDECPTIPVDGHYNVFSSRYQLIANPILRILVWIMGLLAITGNLVVCFYQSKTLFQLRNKPTPASLKANHILVLNLAISDFLMGLYLILLGSYGLKYSGIYCSVALEWLTSQSCNLMGVLSVLSSESSVITLALLTGCRLYSILNPFKCSHKPKLSVVIISLILTWAIAFTLALVPLSYQFQGMFVEDALILDNPFFLRTRVNFETAKIYVIKLFTFGGNVTSSLDYDAVLAANAWKDLPIVNTERFFGYYSTRSVCLFKLFVTTREDSWIFSIVVTLFNFVCFMFVCAAYIMIVCASKKTKSVRAQIRETKDRKQNNLEKKVIRLIVTDFCCWVPITIMALINVSLYELPGKCYAVAAIVLLPINSALNPILYSNAIDNLVAICKRKKVKTIANKTISKTGSMETEKFNLTRVKE